jgi:hypothetical protein
MMPSPTLEESVKNIRFQNTFITTYCYHRHSPGTHYGADDLCK